MFCNKFVLFFTNIVTLVIGVAVVTFASIFISKGEEYGELMFEGILTVPAVVLIFGIFVTVIGILGCCGAIKENKCMLYTYAIIVIALLIGIFSLAVFILAAPEKAVEKLETSMNSSFSKYGGEDEALTELIDKTQEELKCCGVTGYKDWEKWNGDRKEVPLSCCIELTDGCNKLKPINQNKIYQNGCLDAIVEEMEVIGMGLGISAILLSLIMVANIAASCTIAKRRIN